jgi:hypothetical protein
MSLAPSVEQRTLKVVYSNDLYLLRVPRDVEIYVGNQNVVPMTQRWEDLPQSVRDEFRKQLNRHHEL